MLRSFDSHQKSFKRDCLYNPMTGSGNTTVVSLLHGVGLNGEQLRQSVARAPYLPADLDPNPVSLCFARETFTC